MVTKGVMTFTGRGSKIEIILGPKGKDKDSTNDQKKGETTPPPGSNKNITLFPEHAGKFVIKNVLPCCSTYQLFTNYINISK
jgi:hypothetical protein